MANAIGPYDLEAELGRGGSGCVYRGRHRETGFVRAVKVLDQRGDPELAARFRREAEILARLEGGGIVPVHELGEDRGRLYFAMTLMPGGSLRGRLARSGALGWREAAELVHGLTRTLERAHAAGLVHRDVKPENVLFDEQGKPRLADFGCARDLAAASLTETGTVLGTPGYMAPEQLDGRPADDRADVFALGVLLHELVAGAKPYAGRSAVELLSKILAGRRQPLNEAPAALETLVARALSPDPSRRGGASDLAAGLEALLAAKERGPARRRALLAGAIFLAAVAVAGGASLARRGQEGPSTATVEAKLAELAECSLRVVDACLPLRRARLGLEARGDLGAVVSAVRAFDVALPREGFFSGAAVSRARALRADVDRARAQAAVDAALGSGDLAAAEKAWRELPAEDPERPVFEVLVALDAGDLSRAREKAGAIPNTDHPVVVLVKARVAVASGFPSQALESLESLALRGTARKDVPPADLRAAIARCRALALTALAITCASRGERAAVGHLQAARTADPSLLEAAARSVVSALLSEGTGARLEDVFAILDAVDETCPASFVSPGLGPPLRRLLDRAAKGDEPLRVARAFELASRADPATPQPPSIHEQLEALLVTGERDPLEVRLALLRVGQEPSFQGGSAEPLGSRLEAIVRATPRTSWAVRLALGLWHAHHEGGHGELSILQDVAKDPLAPLQGRAIAHGVVAQLVATPDEKLVEIEAALGCLHPEPDGVCTHASEVCLRAGRLAEAVRWSQAAIVWADQRDAGVADPELLARGRAATPLTTSRNRDRGLEARRALFHCYVVGRRGDEARALLRDLQGLGLPKRGQSYLTLELLIGEERYAEAQNLAGDLGSGSEGDRAATLEEIDRLRRLFVDRSPAARRFLEGESTRLGGRR